MHLIYPFSRFGRLAFSINLIFPGFGGLGYKHVWCNGIFRYPTALDKHVEYLLLKIRQENSLWIAGCRVYMLRVSL